MQSYPGPGKGSISAIAAMHIRINNTVIRFMLINIKFNAYIGVVQNFNGLIHQPVTGQDG
ncbi:hypothetical protein A8C56_16860 [Niabella ginsenosidivorans]|uniref:Uncharacterized protein n=1 Tax=Niabella ginsenosidivorans TaxID=1176587 RepID=A0A1A9I463_9BACT|nr:hypothetical protein [Niabella ginsenosidivorans]ANH82416.1 hypothetical protein A8C56_16860 [Niabella ginsenosidivorans]